MFCLNLLTTFRQLKSLLLILKSIWLFLKEHLIKVKCLVNTREQVGTAIKQLLPWFFRPTGHPGVVQSTGLVPGSRIVAPGPGKLASFLPAEKWHLAQVNSHLSRQLKSGTWRRKLLFPAC
jgi:hypothetical protein